MFAYIKKKLLIIYLKINNYISVWVKLLGLIVTL